MRAPAFISLILALATMPALANSDLSISGHFARTDLTVKHYLADNSDFDFEGDPLEADIYEFGIKSTKRAFFYSLAVPGAGQYYVGSRIKPFVYLGIEATIWAAYFIYQNKGDNKKNEYIAFADAHYNWRDFRAWWNTIPEDIRDDYSHEMPWDDYNNRPIFNHEYYENIGKYNEFQIGWDDINTEPPPFGEETTSPHRDFYLELRRQANDFYQNSNTMVMVAIGNHLISAFDAALTAKNFNKGQKRFSLKFKSRDMGRHMVPVLAMDYTF